MNQVMSAFVAAVLFGVGLGISGMTLPSKVIGFLDVTGDWDVSLMFVMLGAIFTHAISYKIITKRSSPIFAEKFYLPSKQDIDRPLILGAAIFGIGWGLAGFCPGPALVTMTTGKPEILIFVAFMVLGMYFFRLYKRNT